MSWDSADAELILEAASYASRPPGRALDVGTGAGRLLPTMTRLVENVVALDPDGERVAKARQTCGRTDDALIFVTADANSYVMKEPFDLVVCCHVLQHVSRRDRAVLARSLRRFTSAGGVLVMMFSSAIEERHFASSLPRGGKIESTVIDPREFDALAMQVDADAKQRLPVWHARIGDVVSLTTDAGFHVLESFEYRRFDFSLRRHEGEPAEIASASDACIIAVPAHRAA